MPPPHLKYIDGQWIKTDCTNTCDDCNEDYEDYCTKCRMLIHILNRNTISNINSRNRNELPNDILEIREVLEHCGVYTLKYIPKGVIFGPFTGLRTLPCSWRIRGGRFLVDNDKLELLNWMQFISPAQNIFEHNLVVFRYDDNIYYRSNHEIEKDTELLVYFGEEYDNSLINDVEVNFVFTTEKDIEDVFACTFCCLGFNSIVHLTKHKTTCPNDAAEITSSKEITQCAHCKIYMEQWEYLGYHEAYCQNKKDGQRIVAASKEHSIATSKSNNQQDNLKLDLIDEPTSVKEKEALEYFLYETNYKSHLDAHLPPNHCAGAKDEKKDDYTHDGDTRETKREDGSHVEAHAVDADVTEKRFKCAKCDFTTLYKNNLKTHLGIHETVKQFKCAKCDYETCRKIDLKKHSYKHEAVKRFKCSKCDYDTNDKRNLERHLGIHDTVKRFKCDRCDYATSVKSNFKLHMDTHEEVKRYKCAKCDYATNIRDYLNKHSVTHETVRRFKCDKCDYATNRSNELKTHSFKHAGIKLFKCSKCDYGTNTKKNLKTHSDKHENRAKRFKCEECDYATNVKGNLKTHYDTHETVKLYKCPDCEYETNVKSKLSTHSYTHETVKRFKCSECEYATHHKSCLKTHSYTHDETVKLFKCARCDYATNTKRKLTTHSYSHESAKRFKCSICDYAANQKHHLKKHINTHDKYLTLL